MANVLIVDDDPSILRALVCIIEGEGHDVFAVPGGVEALEVLGERGIDLAVVDLNMPDMNGIALMRWMRKAYPGIKLAPMSAVSDLLSAPSELTMEDVQAVLADTLEKGQTGA